MQTDLPFKSLEPGISGETPARQEPKESRPGLLRRRILVPFLLMLFGVVALFGIALWQYGAHDPWSRSLLLTGGESPYEGAIAARFRLLPRNNLPANDPIQLMETGIRLVEESTKNVDFTFREGVVLMDLPPSEWPPLLATGRAPAPGQQEVAAGPLVRRTDQINLDGEVFTVVGQFKPSVAGLSFAYALPQSEGMAGYFAPEAGGKKAWVVTDAAKALIERAGAGETLASRKLAPGGALLTITPVLATIASLILIAAAGSLFQVRLVMLFLRWRTPLRPMLRAMSGYMSLLQGLHLLHYAFFFVFMLAGNWFPRTNLFAVEVVREIFTEGPLKHVGSAYASGSIVLASWATFYNNYLVQTVQYCIVPSLFIPFLGVLKNLLAFSFAGFAMTPIWAGHADMLTYHSITMVLEFEGYILAAFAVVLFPYLLVRGLAEESFLTRLKESVLIVGSGTLLAGLVLAAAAFYEAATLILIG